MRAFLTPGLRHRLVPGALAIALLAATTAPAQGGSPPLPSSLPVHGDAECEVWARELGFAASVAAHDVEAFAAHVDPDAAFGSGQVRPLRGREAIVQAWAGLIAGREVRLAWYPTRVTIAAVPDIAWSSGPALYEAVDPVASPRHRIGAFNSVWRRGSDGTWRVIFDDGLQPRPATEAEVAAFHLGRREACPRG
ncbi:YybH family protein [Marilutibacter spongiae]|uniref:DUF4440 domain-containing protein n=1 Tax=Marilutibacter spongiae TaxID=2025720 RepID=A0A7W3TKQ6_9GAMM|nr:DUF4440 domain-containing protein [Lysobacter spongiae]MBB1059734.1 DUF4440 domain-containing protein [Lysobacter spongiae]